MARNAAYLYAIEHGARYIFDAYPDTFASAGVDVTSYRAEMHHQLLNLTLHVALGLVSERPFVKRVQNPYAHFGRPDFWTHGFRRDSQRFVHNHEYRICEVRPPSIEKVVHDLQFNRENRIYANCTIACQTSIKPGERENADLSGMHLLLDTG